MSETKHAPPGALLEALYLAREEAASMLVSIRAVFLVVTYSVIAGAIGAALLWLNDKTDGNLLKGAEALKTSPELAVEKLVEVGLNPHLAEAMVNGDLPPLVLGELFRPEVLVLRRWSMMLRADVPEAAVDEDRDSGLREQHIRATPEALDRRCVDPVAKPFLE